MKLHVRLWGSASANSAGYPAAWPAMVTPVPDDTQAPIAPVLQMTLDEFIAYGAQHLAEFQAWQAALSVDQRTAPMLAALAMQRWTKETAGVYFTATGASSPSLYGTDREAQMKIIGAAHLASAGALPNGATWKTADGFFVPLATADLVALLGAAATYIQACYTRESVLAAEIRAGGSPDVTTGWPSRGTP
jgi:hypothetical protein